MNYGLKPQYVSQYGGIRENSSISNSAWSGGGGGGGGGRGGGIERSYASNGYMSQTNAFAPSTFPLAFAGQVPMQTGQYPFAMSTAVDNEILNLHVRIVKARQVNILCKQALVRNHIMQLSSSQPRQSPAPLEHRSTLPMKTDSIPPYLNAYSKEIPADLPAISSNAKSSTPQNNDRRPSAQRSPDAPQPNAIPLREGPPEQTDERLDEPSQPSPIREKDMIEEEDDDSFIPESSYRPVVPGQSKEYAKTFNEIVNNMTDIVETNTAELDKINHMKRKKQNEHKVKKDEAKRNKADKLLKIESSTTSIMPKWRHLLEGRLNPSPEQILSGRRLFKLIAKGLLNFIVKPNLTFLKQQLAARDIQHRDLGKSLRLIYGSLDEWLGKLVQLPLSSIVQDPTLNFELLESYVSNSVPVKTRQLQLKVRLKAIVNNLCRSEMPPDIITGFLNTLIEDNNYFTRDILWDCEVDKLQFTSIGATRDVVMEVSPNESGPNILCIEVAETDSTNRKCFQVERAKLIMRNFVLIRLLIAHVILSPWNYGVCGKPQGGYVKRCIMNNRILATVMYCIVRSIDGNCLRSVEEIKNNKEEQSSQNSSQYIIPSTVTNQTIGSGLIFGKTSKDQSSSDPSRSTAAETAAATGDLVDAARNEQLVNNSNSNDSNISAQERKINTDGILGKFAKLVGIKDIGGVDILSKGSIDSYLLEPRTNDHLTISELSRLLLSLQQIGISQSVLDEWSLELNNQLSDWVDRLVGHVLKWRIEQKARKDKKEIVNL